MNALNLTPSPKVLLAVLPAGSRETIKALAEDARKALVVLNRELGNVTADWGPRDLANLVNLTEPLVDAAVVLSKFKLIETPEAPDGDPR